MKRIHLIRIFSVMLLALLVVLTAVACQQTGIVFIRLNFPAFIINNDDFCIMCRLTDAIFLLHTHILVKRYVHKNLLWH